MPKHKSKLKKLDKNEHNKLKKFNIVKVRAQNFRATYGWVMMHLGKLLLFS
jgi:hypothetical protein